MYLVLELYTCIHDSDEIPLVLSEQVDQIDNCLNIFSDVNACQTWLACPWFTQIFPARSLTIILHFGNEIVQLTQQRNQMISVVIFSP